MPMPPWFEEILKQSPILAVAVLICWYAFRQYKTVNDLRIAAAEASFLAHMKALEKAHANHLSSKDAEIARLQSDKDALLKTIQKGSKP